MQHKCPYIEIPVQVIAHLRSLSGEEFKMIGAFCYLRSNGQKSPVLLEQIQKFSGIPEKQLKPTLYRLIKRGWLLESGNNSYHLAFNSADGATSSPTVSPQLATNYDPSLGIRPPRVKVHLLYPEGPWLVDGGLLDEAFVRDRAEVWRTGNHYSAQSYGAMAIEDVMGAICKHYAKPENHGNLEIDWHSYCAKNQRYLMNVQQRIRSGVAIQPDEQEKVLKKLLIATQDAVSPYESFDVASKSSNTLVQTPTISLANNGIPATTISLLRSQTMNNPELPEPIDASESSEDPVVSSKDESPQPSLPTSQNTPPSFTQSMSNPPASPPPPIDFSGLLKSIPSVSPVRPTNMSRPEKLKLWLSDPILRDEAEREAVNHGYEVIYNDYGTPIDIRTDGDEYDDF
jgi:hypothetical protein